MFFPNLRLPADSFIDGASPLQPTRTILVLAANSIAIGRPDKLKFFYQRIKAKKGQLKEMYSEEEGKQKNFKVPKFIPAKDFGIETCL